MKDKKPSPENVSAAAHELDRAAELYERNDLPGRAERALDCGKALLPPSALDTPCEGGENDAYGAAVNAIWRLVRIEDNPQSVIFRLWDIIRAAIGGEDKERLTGAKNQVKELSEEFAETLLFFVKNRIEDFLKAEQSGRRSVTRLEVDTAFSNAFQDANRGNLERMTAFGDFMFERPEHRSYWNLRVEQMFRGDIGQGPFKNFTDDLCRDMGWK